jgi:hypothetical protein
MVFEKNVIYHIFIDVTVNTNVIYNGQPYYTEPDVAFGTPSLAFCPYKQLLAFDFVFSGKLVCYWSQKSGFRTVFFSFGWIKLCEGRHIFPSIFMWLL